MKYLTLILATFFALPALAISECAGRASDGSFVVVHIETSGSVGAAQSGEVSFEKDGNKYGYRFGHDDIAQYFEYDEESDGSAIVGASAFVNKESPVAIKYVGQNFVDMDLKTVIAEGKGSAQKGNFVRVWKGPGRAATEQFQLTKVVCAVWSNI